MANIDLTEVIEESVEDALTPDTSEDASTDTAVEASTEASTDEASVSDAVETTETESTSEVASPAVAAVDAAKDDFEKKWGIPAKSITGRENRIPHTRVKTMVTKADKDGYDRGTKEITAQLQPKLSEFETKVRDYEGRLEKVAQFENILESDPRTFLTMLSQVPAYKPFFEQLEKLAAAGQPAQEAAPVLSSEMPQPDQTMTDGSKVYSMEGLQKLLEWQSKQVEERAVKQAEERASKRFGPIEKDWQARQEYDRAAYAVEGQIAEARKWDKFSELEPRVIELLKADKQADLKTAYIRAYHESVVSERERLSTDRNKLRTEILAEIKSKPISSSSPVGAVKPDAQSSGPRSIEQIIEDEVRKAGLR